MTLQPIGKGGAETPAFDDNRWASTPFKTDDLPDLGFLWAINRLVFHPRGWALSWSREEQSWQLWGDGTEAWQFDYETDKERQAVFEKTLADLKAAYQEKTRAEETA